MSNNPKIGSCATIITPGIIPIVVRIIISLMNCLYILFLFAPRAIRKPISDLRNEMLYQRTPKRPEMALKTRNPKTSEYRNTYLQNALLPLLLYSLIGLIFKAEFLNLPLRSL